MGDKRASTSYTAVRGKIDDTHETEWGLCFVLCACAVLVGQEIRKKEAALPYLMLT